jgi:hypothetical protein
MRTVLLSRHLLHVLAIAALSGWSSAGWSDTGNTRGSASDSAKGPCKGEHIMATSADSSHGPRSVRLIFEYDGDQVRLVSQRPVDMAITGSEIARSASPGVYVDSRDAAGRTLARVPAHSAFAHSQEVFPEQPGEPIVRVDVPRPRGAFTVVVPAPPDAEEVAVVRVAPAQPGAPAPSSRGTSDLAGAVRSTDLATFKLTP